MVVAQSASALEGTCLPNHVTGQTAAGTLAITDFAITQNFASCPTLADNLGTQFPAEIREPIYIWLRLEGDTQFASTFDPKSRFSVRIHRKSDFIENESLLDIDNDTLDRESVLAEAQSHEGHFDWRLYVAVWMYLVPGEYTLDVRFGDRDVCKADEITGPSLAASSSSEQPASVPSCDIEFRVDR